MRRAVSALLLTTTFVFALSATKSNAETNSTIAISNAGLSMRLKCFQDIYKAIYEPHTNVLGGCTQSMQDFGDTVQENVNSNRDGIGENATIISVLQSKNTKLSDNGIEVGGKRLIHKSSDGVISVGHNSMKFGNEELGNQSMWATDQNGVVDINIINGSDLLINGRSVQGQINRNEQRINSLGDGVAASTALSSALSALPTSANDAPFSCGIGSGAYSSRFAMSVGCAAKLQERLSLNIGGSTVFGGSSNYGGGTLDTVAVRGGFVFKLGKLDSPDSTTNQLQSKVESLEDSNARILEENASLKANYSIMDKQNKALMARLERLEAIALGQNPNGITMSKR